MPSLTAKFTYDDRGFMEAQSAAARVGSSALRVGIVGPKANQKHTDTGMSVVEIGLLNEFGATSADVPARPFLRGTFRRRESMFKNLLAIAIKRVVFQRASADDALNWVGERAADEVRATIMGRQTPYPNNAVRTIQRKGFNHPLLETGLLLESIAHRIVRTAGAGAVSTGVPEEIA